MGHFVACSYNANAIRDGVGSGNGATGGEFFNEPATVLPE